MKIVLFANTDWYLYNFRLSLAQALKARGDEVLLLSPPGKYVVLLEKAGFKWIAFPLSRRGSNPLVELDTLARLIRFYRLEKPGLVHHFTIKCVLYGSLAARFVGIRRVINSITGLGYVFTDQKQSASMMRSIIIPFYRLALKGTRVVFQNPDDQAEFLANRLIIPQQSWLIRGSGIDLDRFPLQPPAEGVPLVILPGRLLWDKGVGEYVAASRRLRAEGSNARFALVGDIDLENPSCVPLEQLQAWQKEGVIEWWDWQNEMGLVYAAARIVCLPSYREGLPRTLLEAASSGRAIITTNTPGCREAVRSGETGLLIPVKDPIALSFALRELLADSERCNRMGLAGRAWAESEFSVQRVISDTLKVYDVAG